MFTRLIVGRNPSRTFRRIFLLLIVSGVTFGYVLLPIRAEGISMLPTYSVDSLKLVNTLAYRFTTPRRGDVVAIRLAGPSVVYVKRILALPGERIRMARGTVYIDGRTLAEPYVKNRSPWTLQEIRLGEDEYFVAGDNRGMAIENHTLGRARRTRIIGKVMF